MACLAIIHRLITAMYTRSKEYEALVDKFLKNHRGESIEVKTSKYPNCYCKRYKMGSSGGELVVEFRNNK